MSIRHLKIKIKSLAAEAKFIRHEERKTKPQIERKEVTLSNGHVLRYQTGEYFSLHEHRTGTVRGTARESLLAYGYLRGRTYAQIEQKYHFPPDWKEVLKAIKRFDAAKGNLTEETFAEWFAAT